MTVLGVDVGLQRVGLAASDESETIASPMAVVARQQPQRLWRRLTDEVAQRQVRCVVVGLPRRLDGREGEQAADARAFADEVAHHTGVAVEMWDERFTTQAAERALISGGVRRRERRDRIDAVAAALLLQSWLDHERARAGR